MSLIRALLNDPDLLVLDEPTSALDDYNSILIMNFLKEEATRRAIFIVSHNVKMLENYVHYLYILKNKRINLINKKKLICTKNEIKEINNNNLSFNFLYKYLYVNFKRKKVKSFFFIFTLFISMFVVGFSLILTHDVSSMVIESLNSLTDENQIIMKGNVNLETKIEEISPNEEEVKDILDSSSYFYDYGYIYSSNFEEQFIDNNYMEISDVELAFYEIGARDISETVLLSDIDNSFKFYPYRPINMENDEIIIGFKKNDIKKICKSLSLDNLDEESLSSYMKFNELTIKFKFTNIKWNYDIEVPLKLKAFFVSNDDTFLVHSNTFFVTHIFEKVMKLPISDNMSIIDLYPWTIKKQIYLKSNELDISNAVLEYFNSYYYEDYDLNILKGNIHSSLFSSSFHKGKFLVSYASRGKLSFASIKDYLKGEDINNIFPTGSYYEAIESALVSGFTNSVFVSSDKKNLEEVSYYFNDLEENIDTIDISKFDLGKAAYGNLISSALKKGLKLSSTYGKIECGRTPMNIDEVMISSSLCNKLFSSYHEALNQKLFFMVNNYNYDDGNTFSHTYLTISGVFNDENERLYQDLYWYPTFLVCRLDYPLKAIQINKFLVNSSSTIDELNSLNKNLVFINPFTEMNKSVDSMIEMINIILSIFATLLILSSFGVSQISIQTSMKEASKEIGLFKLIGINRKSIFILYFTYNIFNFVFAYILAFLNLFFITKFVSVYYFKLAFTMSIYLEPFIIMLLLGALIVLPLSIIYTCIPVFSRSVTLIKRYY